MASTPSQASQEISPEKRQSLFDAGIWYHLSLWSALNVACANGWGGPDSLEKKDWFAGAVSDLFAQHPNTDAGDLQLFLLQIMIDEFETDLDDDSEEEVTQSLMALFQGVIQDGDLSTYYNAEQRWKNRGLMKTDVKLAEANQDVDGDVDDEEWVDGEGDVNMDDASVVSSTPSRPKEKQLPEVDGDGFTKVVGKGRR